jgi:cell division transport system permease protein
MSRLKSSLKVFNVVFKDRFFYRFSNILFQWFIFLLFLLFSAAFYNLNYYLDKTSSSVVFYAFLKKNVQAGQQAENVKKIVANWPEAGHVKLISREEGLAILKKSLGKESSILNALDVNPLPATLEISIKPEFTEKENIEQIREKMKRYEQFEWVDSTERYLGSVLKLKKIFVNIFIGGIATLLLLIVFSLRSTTKNFLYKYKETVAVMKLLGASPGFIMFPLVMECFAETLTSSVLSSLTCFYILEFLRTQLYLLNINIMPLPGYVYVIFSLSVSCIGALGGLTFKKIPEP